MFDHVTIRVTDREASEAFYTTVLGAAGIGPPRSAPTFVEWEDFSLTAASEERPVTRGLHIAFAVPSRQAVDAFWRAGVAAGHPDDGAPGVRPEYSPTYYGGFLRDPDGNSVEAVHREGMRQDGHVDHLWVRVADTSASQDFWTTVAPAAGLRVEVEGPGHISVVRTDGGGGEMSFLQDERPTEHVHIAFPGIVADVHAFHEAAVAAGYRSDGAPGERAQYHPGYYGAFVLDPDGNGIEVVDHQRGG
jgi:catechol 2,3-dioxygenase-like lactoylglutathione lyase family enzyme